MSLTADAQVNSSDTPHKIKLVLPAPKTDRNASTVGNTDTGLAQ